jgi:NAD(P)-dependent dehydrogenase (short-subunit alcohol dehydrogenase family)
VSLAHEGRVAVVTGAAQGLGQAYAERLAAGGAHVVVADVANGGTTVARIEAAGGEAIAVACDVSERDSVAGLFRATQDRFGAADILVNNAGLSQHVPWAEVNFELWRRTLSVNLDGQFLTCRAFVPGMQERGWGRVINVSSSTVGLALDGWTHYMASKMGVIGFTRALATDVGRDGVTANAFCPGLTHTPTTDEMWDGTTLFDQVAQMQAIKREGVPSDLAGAISFLASDDAAWMSGQTVVVDGGLMRV